MATNTRSGFAIAIPQIFSEPRVESSVLQIFLTRAEALGYHSAWVQEQILGPARSLEPVVLLSYAAAVTRTLRLGSAVLLTPLRNPVQLAKSVATLDQLSGGRLIVGVGLGADPSVYPAFGLSPQGRVRRFVEGVSLMKRLWSDATVTFDGEFWKLKGVAMEPKPVQKPHPPLWFGAREPAALRRAVELGDGWIGGGNSSTENFRTQVSLVREYLEAERRDPSTFRIAKRVYLAVDRDRERALNRLREWSATYYGDRALVERASIVGEAGEVTEGLWAVRAAGAELIVLNPVFDQMDHLERLASEIVPSIG